MASGDEGGDTGMPEVGDVELDKDSALEKLLAAVAAAGMDTKAVRAELEAQISKLVSQQWTTAASKRARKAAKEST